MNTELHGNARDNSYLGEVTGLTQKGEGIVRVTLPFQEIKVYEVARVFPGERVLIEPYISKRRQLKKKAKLKKVIQSSWDKREPFCEHYLECGGCSIQELSYEQQLELKTIMVRTLMQKLFSVVQDYGKYEKPILYSDQQRYYRNKVDYTCGAVRWHKVAEKQNEYVQKDSMSNQGLGFHVKGFYDKVAHLSHCYLHDSNEIRDAVYRWSLSHNVAYYNSRSHEGWMRTLTIRNNIKGDVMVIISVTTYDKDLIEGIVTMLSQKFDSIVSIYTAINTKNHDSMSDVNLELEYGNNYIVEKCGHIQLKITPTVFYQTNSYLAPKLYAAIEEAAEFRGDETVLDLYCGIGSIGLYISKCVKFVVGIDIVEDSIVLARENAILNAIDNVEYHSGMAEDVLTHNNVLLENKFDVVIVDPPRAGLHPKVIKYLLNAKVWKIVYISCNPTTLVSDLALLQEVYTINHWQVGDMFPHTHHVETVVRLTRVE